jgi:hypothetical protein
MPAAITIGHKRGDTFRQDVVVKINNVAVNITDWDIESMLRDVDKALLETFTVTKIAAATGQYRISATAEQTALWPIGKARMDIQYTYPSDGDFRVSSQTYDVKIIEDITYAE